MEEINHGCYNQTKLERIPLHLNVTRREDLFCVLRWTLLNKNLIFFSVAKLYLGCSGDAFLMSMKQFFFLAMLCGMWDPTSLIKD